VDNPSDLAFADSNVGGWWWTFVMEETAYPAPTAYDAPVLTRGAIELERRSLVVERVRAADRVYRRAAAERLEAVNELRREAEAVNAAGQPGQDPRDRVRFKLSHDIERRSVRAEAALALGISERAAETQLELARALTTELRATLEALRTGEISERHARLLWEHAVQVPADLRAEFEQQALDAAHRLNPARFAARLHGIQERLRPETAIERHRAAVETRDVWLDSLADGMAILSIRDSAEKLIAAQNLIEQCARALKADPAETRTLTQLRADLSVQFLLGGQVGDHKIVPTAHVVVPALSAAGVSEELAILEGYGPMELETARKLLADAPVWIRVMTHPATGTVLATDKYKPTQELRDWLRMRDGTCRIPGCGRRAIYTELDHTVERASDNGPTAFDNLANLCVNHHTLKTVTDWNYRHLDRFGTLEWTTPLGETYISEPAHRMRGAPHLADAVARAVAETDADIQCVGDPPDPLSGLDGTETIPDDLWAELQAYFDAELEADRANGTLVA
jgi:hypothetical protein